MRFQQPRQSRAGSLAGLVILSYLALLPLSGQAHAAERVVLTYQSLRRSVSVEELSTFADSGETTPELEAYLERTGKSQQEVRQILNSQASINALTLDRLLNTPLGDTALDRVSQAIHTPSRRSDRQAMRSALMLSATDDNRVSLMEVVEKYPTSEVHVDIENLLQTYQDLYAIQQQVEQVGNILDRLPRF